MVDYKSGSCASWLQLFVVVTRDGDEIKTSQKQQEAENKVVK